MFGKIFGKKTIPFGLLGLEFPAGAELEHTIIPATTGSGKSQTIHLLINRVLEGIDSKPDLEKALITDPDGQFMSSRAHPNDQILNPADRRSKRWNPFAEIRSELDYKLLSSAAIPTDGFAGQEKDFRSYAQTMLAALLKGLHRAGKPDPREVQRLLASVDPEALTPYLVGTPAEALLSPANERFFGSVMGVASEALAAWDFLDPEGDFSIREWIRSGKGVLFLTYTAAQIETLRPLLGCWLSLAIRETLSLPIELDDRGVAPRRVWYVTDELDAGPIIEQDTVRIDHGDTVDDLVRYGRDIEKTVLSRGLRFHVEDRVLVCGNKTIVFR